MNLSNLRPPKGMKHAKKRVGRGQGSGNGKTAGRGHKGAKSRSGFRFKRGFEGGTVVTLELLASERLISGVKKRLKVLGRGEIGKALTVRAHRFSGKAAEKIAAAGGATEQLP